MDKRINLLNTLKKRLNNLTSNQNIINKDENTDTAEYLRLTAKMLNERILSGLAFDEYTFYRNEVFAESTHGDKLCYHIYPLMNSVSKQFTSFISVDNKVVEMKSPIEVELRARACETGGVFSMNLKNNSQ